MHFTSPEFLYILPFLCSLSLDMLPRQAVWGLLKSLGLLIIAVLLQPLYLFIFLGMLHLAQRLLASELRA